MGNVIDFNERRMAKIQNSAPTQEEIDKALQEAADYLCQEYNFDREKVLSSECIACESNNDDSYNFHFVSTVPPKRRGGSGIFVFNKQKKKVWLLRGADAAYEYNSWTTTQMDFYRRKTRKSQKQLVAAEIKPAEDMDQVVAEINEMIDQLANLDLSPEEMEELYTEIKEILGDEEEAVAELKNSQRTKLVIHNKNRRILNSGKQFKNPCQPKDRK